jgi:hypothetical protein
VCLTRFTAAQLHRMQVLRAHYPCQDLALVYIPVRCFVVQMPAALKPAAVRRPVCIVIPRAQDTTAMPCCVLPLRPASSPGVCWRCVP